MFVRLKASALLSEGAIQGGARWIRRETASGSEGRRTHSGRAADKAGVPLGTLRDLEQERRPMLANAAKLPPRSA